MQWSKYQTAIFDEYHSGSGHVCVEAVPGSGKTTSAVEMLNHYPTGFKGDVLLTSFGRDIVKELRTRNLPWSVDVRTLNSLGYRALESAGWNVAKLSEYRVYRILDDVMKIADEGGFRARVKALTDLAKAALVSDVTGLLELADSYDIDTAPPEGMRKQLSGDFECPWEDALAVVVTRVLQRCKTDDGNGIDYNDQLWLPVVLDLPVQIFDRVIVDEGQDTNACQLSLIEMATEQSGRVFMFGESAQALYRFRGAGIGMQPFIDRFKAKSLPLSISYRCPKSVVAEAAKIVPGIQAAPGAPDGYVGQIQADMLLGRLQIGDVVLSRSNAPLIKLFMECIAHGLPVGMAGRDIGARLLKFVESSKAIDVVQLREFTSRWAKSEIERRKKRNKNADTSAVDDHVDCIEALCVDTNQILVVTDRIKKMLMVPPEQKVLLSTVHRFKGKEADRTFVLTSTFPTHAAYWRERANRKKGDIEKWASEIAARILKEDIEERNVLYVAVSRSKQELIYVG